MSQSTEALKAELDVLRDVYGAMRTEIREAEDKITNNLNYTLAAVGAVVVLINFVTSTLPAILLVLPFVFYILALKNLEHHRGIYELSGYLLEKVYPRIREIVVVLAGGVHDFGSFDVDYERYHSPIGFRRLLALPISASNYGLHILFSLLPVVMFFYVRHSGLQAMSTTETVLFIADVLGLIALLAYLISFRVLTRVTRGRANP